MIILPNNSEFGRFLSRAQIYFLPKSDKLSLMEGMGAWGPDVSAEYSLLANNRINVVNSCSKYNGRIHKEAHGRVWVIDKTTNAKIKVSFYQHIYNF